MPIYHQLGRIPRKRHVAFRKDDGGIHYEELVGNQGFTGPASLLYHLRLPTVVKSVQQLETLQWVAEPDRVLLASRAKMGNETDKGIRGRAHCCQITLARGIE
jgi:homogentisate 1,2-dioxygenase